MQISTRVLMDQVVLLVHGNARDAPTKDASRNGLNNDVIPVSLLETGRPKTKACEGELGRGRGYGLYTKLSYVKQSRRRKNNHNFELRSVLRSKRAQQCWLLTGRSSPLDESKE